MLKSSLGRLLGLVFLLGPFRSDLVLAQPSFDDFDLARHRRGPVAVRPQLSITDFGVDTNVFNAVTDPGADFTFSVRPVADVWARSGRWEAAGRTQAGLNFFRHYSSERSADTDNRLRLTAQSANVSTFVTAMFLTTRDRISPEINERVRHLERAGTVGVDLRVGPRSSVRASLGRLGTRYSDNVAAGGFAEALNRSETVATLAARYRLTTLTTLVFEGQRQANRFVFERSRNANTITVLPGVEFGRGALIGGRGFVGYRRLDFRDPLIPDFRGLAASVDLSYTFQTATKFGLTADRNVEYSFEFEQPYFVSSGMGLTMINQTTDRWSLLALINRRHLAYRAFPRLNTLPPRTDRVTQTRLGVGYRVAPRIRAELTANYQGRSSPRVDRRFDGLRLGSAIFFEF